MGSVAACLADEFGLALTVGLAAMTTRGAGTAGVARIDDLDRHACQLRLVGQERIELGERPTREPIASVGAPSGNPFANTAEVFDGNPAPGALGLGDDRFADH